MFVVKFVTAYIQTSKKIAFSHFASDCVFSVTAAALLLLHIVLLVFLCRQDGKAKTIWSIPTAAVSIAATTLLFLLLQIEGRRLSHPSFLISIYLCTTVVFRAAIARTYWALGPGGVLASTSLAVVGVQLLLIVVESLSYRRETQTIFCEGSAGILSHSFFVWLDPLLLHGYQWKLKSSHLEAVCDVLKSTRLTDEFIDLQNYPASTSTSMRNPSS